MNVFNAVTGDKILFVGEGNFSFCVDFIKQHNKEDVLSGIEVIATCFESGNNLLESKKNNIEFLKQKGVTILFDVDAKRVKDHPSIGCKVFTKIIFNFPHVGGKMKINLNRELLREFFLSSKYILDESGVILLTLCDGQGGTDADTNKRRWDDTWKVVELAAEAELALKNVHQFNQENFPGYVNIGYRSLEKGFNTNNALTHVFKICKRDVITILNECGDTWSSVITEKPFFDKKSVSKVYALKISQNPFNNKFSPQLFLFEQFSKGSFNKAIKFYNNVELVYGYSHPNKTSLDAVKEQLDVGYCMNYEQSISVHKGMCLHKLSSDFSKQPVSCEIICVGSDCLKYVFKILTELSVSFNSNNVIQFDEDSQELLYIENRNRLHVAKKESILLNGCKVDVCTILLDNFAIGIFNLSGWHELWAENSKIVQNGSEIKLLTPCVFPYVYVFDLSFSVQKELYVEEEFIELLWGTVGNIICNVVLISTYEPPNKAGYKHFCYRIKYRSYEVPLCKKRVIEIQRILGQILGKELNVTVL